MLIVLGGAAAACSAEGLIEPAGSGGASAHGDGGVSAGAGGYGPARDAGVQEDAGGSGMDAGRTPEAGSGNDAGITTTGMPCAPPTTYDGEIPTSECGDVGPEVKMDCPGDPSAGWTEYKDTFHVERPYNVPIASRFKIEDGIYTFWVFPNDKPHSTTTHALNPRTEARWSQNFTTGIRMWSADAYWERNVNHSVVMQVHTTTTGIGPVYLHVEGEDLPPVDGADVPGGLMDRWINMKVIINAATTASQIYINNCLRATIPKGTRGNGVDYFKNGVYHCGSTVCRDHYKNFHLYMK